jgi:hypothetical protein
MNSYAERDPNHEDEMDDDEWEDDDIEDISGEE